VVPSRRVATRRWHTLAFGLLSAVRYALSPHMLRYRMSLGADFADAAPVAHSRLQHELSSRYGQGVALDHKC
jgi:hypothetical protein